MKIFAKVLIACLVKIKVLQKRIKPLLKSLGFSLIYYLNCQFRLKNSVPLSFLMGAKKVGEEGMVLWL